MADYIIKVRCTNCGVINNIPIPKGIKWLAWFKGQDLDSFLCENCGCKYITLTSWPVNIPEK